MCNYLQLFTTVLHARTASGKGFGGSASSTAAVAVKKIGLIRQTEDVSSLHHCDLRIAAPTRFASNIAVVSTPSTPWCDGARRLGSACVGADVDWS
jgi:hypothetical protein